MKYRNILITGGAGFVGSNLAIKLKEHFSNITITALDNLSRRGSELNLPRLKQFDVRFRHGDIRLKEDLNLVQADLIIECSAEPSVMAGMTSSPVYLIDTNLLGAINCFELARKNSADVVFLSTSRVYPVRLLNELTYVETETRFELAAQQKVVGVSREGVSEDFSLSGIRTLYGTTKLSAEMMLQEYDENYGIRAIIDRFGVIAGPWQMGKVDQGFVAHWVVDHVFGKPLDYIGFGGKGKQVRDVIHVDDVFDILLLQLGAIASYSGRVYNIGGGRANSTSLLELTRLCQKITGETVMVKKVGQTRPGDVRWYISDNGKIAKQSGWRPKKSLLQILEDTFKWVADNQKVLANVLE